MNPAPSLLGSLGAAARALQTYGVGELTWERPWVLLLGLLVAAAAFVQWRRRTRVPVLLASRGEALAALPGRGRLALVVLAHVSILLAAVLVVVSLARPQVLGEPNPDAEEGIDIVVALDVSGSMLAADFKPRDRLTVAKKVIAEHLLTRRRDRLGLVVFAGEAFTQAPLTHDKALLEEILEGVRTGVITDGTAIGDAVATSVNRLRESKAESKVVILVTDGDNNAGNLSPEKAAELAQEFDVQVFPILVGRGGQVPYPRGQDFFGATRYVYMNWPTNPELLKRIATVTGAQFFTATNPKALETSLQQILEAMDKTRLDSGPILRKHIDLYPLLAAAALLLWLLGFVLLTTRASTVP